MFGKKNNQITKKQQNPKKKHNSHTQYISLLECTMLYFSFPQPPRTAIFSSLPPALQASI